MADVVLTTNAHLTGGVGEFAPVREDRLLELMTDEERKVGLGTDGLTAFHSAAWERCKAEFYKPPNNVDLTGELSDWQKTYIKAACCYLIMESLCRRAAGGDIESNDWNEAKFAASRFEEMQSRFPMVASQGEYLAMGQAIQFYRG